MKAGDKVALVGFGTFETRERPARKGRNPRTKEEITIPATTAPAFKAGKALKDAVAKYAISAVCHAAGGPALRLHFSYKTTERSAAMRIDKFMKVSRLIKRRTVANEVVDAGRITVNGKPVKASYAVKEGDVIEVAFGQRPVRVKVVSTEAPTGKDLAREMYVVLSE